jgi:hypothetical protein
MRWLIALTTCILAVPATAANEGVVQTDLGVLTCTLAPASEKGTDPDSQSKAILCTFKPQGTGPEETYTGEIKKVGSQTALTDKLVMIWAVMGPHDRKLTPGILAQTYVGAAPGDTGDTAEHAKRLTGESDDKLELQPISDGTVEPGASDNVTVLELRVKTTAS